MCFVKQEISINPGFMLFQQTRGLLLESFATYRFIMGSTLTTAAQMKTMGENSGAIQMNFGMNGTTAKQVTGIIFVPKHLSY